MKIAHVVDSMEIGGAETLVMQMCRLQRERGHDPCVYAIGVLGALGDQMRKEGFQVTSDVGKRLIDSIRNFYRIFKKARPDVVHLHNPTPTIYAAIPARMAGVRSIVSTRHSLVAPPHHWVSEFKYAVASTCCNWISGICDATVSNLLSLHCLSPRKIVRVYNGAVPLQKACSDKYPPKNGFTLLYVGRLAPVKNHRLLLEAFHLALSSSPELHLWMVGDGTERRALEGLAGELGIRANITFWGQQIDVSPYFSAADAFIMSSHSEGLPISLLQALSLGLPAVVTDVGGMSEVVRFAQAGLIVPLEDPAAMAAAIVRLAEDKMILQKSSMNAERAFSSYFTLGTMVDRYESLYRNNQI